MTHRSSNRFSKKVKESYNQNTMNKSVKIPAGVYRGFVVNNDDPRSMGRVKISISKFYGMMDPATAASDPDQEYLGAVWCRMLMPFGGNTPVSGGGQVSYGMTMQPPALDTEVLVAFSGDTDKGIIIGVLPDETRNAGIAGPQAGFSEDGQFTTVTEVAKTRTNENQRAPEHPLAPQLREQGIDKDRLRGLNFSSPRRDPQSQVLGITTPGGHHLIMDDGDLEDGDKNIVRLRSGLGAQILMDDTNGFIYIINRDGTSWVEMNREGDIDVYSKKSINLNSEKHVNIRAAENINLEAGRGFNIKSLGATGIKMHAPSGDINIKGHSGLNLESEANGNLRVAGSYRETAARIDMNGPPALSASTPTPVQHPGNTTVKESISDRVPEHEPWKGHLDVSVADTASISGAVDTQGSRSYYENTPGDPAEGLPNSTSDPAELPEFAESNEQDPTGLVNWRSGVDRRVNPELIEKVGIIARKFGKPLTITSGYRSPTYNARVGGAKRSQHMLGNAVDISGAAFTNQERLQLVALASAEGVNGIGVYNDKSLHFDLRDYKAAWGSGFNYAGIPGYAKSTMDKHLAGGYA